MGVDRKERGVGCEVVVAAADDDDDDDDEDELLLDAATFDEIGKTSSGVSSSVKSITIPAPLLLLL